MLVGFFVSVIACGCIVAFSLSSECWRAVRQNCRRLDGSWSDRRFRREVAAFAQYLATIAAPGLLAFLTLFAASTYVFSYIIPLDLAWDSLQKFDLNPGEWRENLEGVQAEHSRFMRGLGFSDEEIFNFQRALWHEWPLMAGAAFLLVAGSVYAMVRCAAVAVATLATGIRKRRSMYAHGDVVRMRVHQP